MSDVTFDIDGSANERYLKRSAEVASGGLVSGEDIAKAVDDALQPVLSALQQEVAKMGVVTGRLRTAPGVKILRKKGFAPGRSWPSTSVLGMVGYISGRADHDWYVEVGTNVRRGRGIMPAFFLTEKAYSRSREEANAILRARMEELAARAVRKLAG